MSLANIKDSFGSLRRRFTRGPVNDSLTHGGQNAAAAADVVHVVGWLVWSGLVCTYLAIIVRQPTSDASAEALTF